MCVGASLASAKGPAIAQGTKAPNTIDNSTACRAAIEPKRFIGRTITFVGDYITDHIERTLIIPKGCKQGIGVGATSKMVDDRLNAVDDPLSLSASRRIRAIFTATLIQAEPNGAQFFGDPGVRLSVSRVSNIEVIDARRDR